MKVLHFRGTLKLRGKKVDTIIATSRTYPKVKVAASSRVDQSTGSVAAESYSGLQINQSPASNPYCNGLECIKALLQVFALYADSKLKPVLDSVTFEQYTTTTYRLDLRIKDNTPSWLIALQDFKLQNRTFKQWIKDFPYVFLSAGSEESSSDLFTRRIRVHCIKVPVAPGMTEIIDKELGKVVQRGVR